MGVLTSMIVDNSSKRGALQLKKQTLGVFMQEKKVGAHIQHQVLAYLEHGEKQMQTLADIDAIQTLSPTLQEEVAYHTMRAVITTFGLFEVSFGDSFVRQLCSILKLELFGPDDVICQEGHYIARMVFVNSGSVKLFKTVDSMEACASDTSKPSVRSSPSRGATHTSINVEFLTADNSKAYVVDDGEVFAGDSFGAQALLLSAGGYSYFTAICFVFCELVFLTRQSFLAVVNRSPVWEKTLKRIDATLARSTDQKSLVLTFARGSAEDIRDALDEAQNRGSSRSRKVYFADILRRAVGKIKQMKDFLKFGKGDMGFQVTEARSHSEGLEDEGARHATGFQALKMTAAERILLQEISSMREKFQSSIDVLERNLTKVASRVDLNSDRLEKRITALDGRLNTNIHELQRSMSAHSGLTWDEESEDEESQKVSPAGSKDSQSPPRGERKSSKKGSLSSTRGSLVLLPQAGKDRTPKVRASRKRHSL
eukprot:gnl/MRDRNA2_/MRDRNA2_172663_c0_seq1.p1 gnl/MRDRNA2_/MRDRNA2_172663_c0~~gnl/MRDRNA2_/MRDRNA2_172663_c0_seq1.p1  ORF type:complete len:521 (-),score=98.33 gnl/MRDRNA2_/MRDRNA2_172663_c0_seq1:185-1633(-)